MSLELAYQLCASISAIASFSVVATGLLFPSLMLSSSRPFSQIIFCISLSDFLGSAGNAFGFPMNGSASCTIQAILLNWFMPASWLWTTFLVYQLRCILKYKTLWLKVTAIHAFCWLFSLLLFLLPMSSGVLGVDDATEYQSPCYYYGNPITFYYWGLFLFYCLFFVCFALMVIWSAEVFLHFVNIGIDSSHRAWSILGTTWLYPLAMIVTWLPVTVIFCLGAPQTTRTQYDIDTFIEVLATQYGTLAALIFFCNCAEARQRWKLLFLGSKSYSHSQSADYQSAQHNLDETRCWEEVRSRFQSTTPSLPSSSAGSGASTASQSSSTWFSALGRGRHSSHGSNTSAGNTFGGDIKPSYIISSASFAASYNADSPTGAATGRAFLGSVDHTQTLGSVDHTQTLAGNTNHHLSHNHSNSIISPPDLGCEQMSNSLLSLGRSQSLSRAQFSELEEHLLS